MHAGDERAITNIGQVNEKWAPRQVSYLDRLIHEAGHQPGEWQQAQHTASVAVAPEAAAWQAFRRMADSGAYWQRATLPAPMAEANVQNDHMRGSTGDHQQPVLAPN